MRKVLSAIIVSTFIFLMNCSHLHHTTYCTEPTKTTLHKTLDNFPGIKIKVLEPDSIYIEKYEIMLTQPLNHKNPESEQFQQCIFLSHKGYDAPTVLHTEGYSAGRNFCAELPELINANEIRVEHRFFGKSLPDSMNWQFLNLEQETADYHRIIELFKTIYPGKWINTGWSKGGQTSIFHRYFYPNDVVASVIYDSPINFELEDCRIDEYFEKVGSPECRQGLIDFQRLALFRKDELLPLFKWYTKGKGYKYSIGLEKAFEYVVLEYPFSFWQYKEIDCNTIPTSTYSTDEIFEHLLDVVSFSSYADKSMNSASMFQFSTQLGYYGYVTKNVVDLLSCDDYPNSAFAPQVPELKYDPEPMQKINEWLQEEGNNFIYIYGANDPWSAPAVNISDKVNSKKYYLNRGNHFTFIKTFPEEKQEEILNTIREWIVE